MSGGDVSEPASLSEHLLVDALVIGLLGTPEGAVTLLTHDRTGVVELSLFVQQG